MKKLYFTLLILFSFLEGYSQKFVFSYDESGNRIKREIGGRYNYYTLSTWQREWSGSMSSSCKCFTSRPEIPPLTTEMYINLLSIDSQLAWDFIFPLNASTNSPRGVITIKHITDSQKFETYNIGGNSPSFGNYYYLGGGLLQERGPIALEDGDIVYLSYTIYD